jgi:alginate O-acetyltransferase complex protein AlgI
LLLATYAFAIQIYCDFSGYTDIAIGAALLLGIRLPKNFDAPYLSCSIREFWRRWHISLSTWLRDYLYIPLGGSRKGVSRTYISLMLTMLLGGLWHGAGWHWVVWGALQGAMMSIERALGISEKPPQQMFARLLRWFIVLHLVCLSWVFFRASDVTEALYILRRIAMMATGDTVSLVPALVLLGLITAELLGIRQKFLSMLQARPTVTRWLAYAAVLALVLTYAKASNPEFIYFQF